MGLEEGFGFVDGEINFSLFVFASDDFDLRGFFFEAAFKAFEAVVQVWRSEAALKDGDFAFIVYQFDQFLRAGVACGLIHRTNIRESLRRRGGSVEGDNFDACFGSFLDHRRKALIVQGRNGNAVHVASDDVFYDFDFLGQLEGFGGAIFGFDAVLAPASLKPS
jgi:hypothetical protein